MSDPNQVVVAATESDFIVFGTPLVVNNDASVVDDLPPPTKRLRTTTEPTNEPQTTTPMSFLFAEKTVDQLTEEELEVENLYLSTNIENDDLSIHKTNLVDFYKSLLSIIPNCNKKTTNPNLNDLYSCLLRWYENNYKSKHTADKQMHPITNCIFADQILYTWQTYKKNNTFGGPVFINCSGYMENIENITERIRVAFTSKRISIQPYGSTPNLLRYNLSFGSFRLRLNDFFHVLDPTATQLQLRIANRIVAVNGSVSTRIFNQIIELSAAYIESRRISYVEKKNKAAEPKPASTLTTFQATNTTSSTVSTPEMGKSLIGIGPVIEEHTETISSSAFQTAPMVGNKIGPKVPFQEALDRCTDSISPGQLFFRPSSAGFIAADHAISLIAATNVTIYGNVPSFVLELDTINSTLNLIVYVGSGFILSTIEQ